MKKLYIVAFSLMALSWITTIVFLIILPEQIPMHYNPYVASGIDRFASKFECLIFPASLTLVGSLFLLMARHRRNKGDNSEEKAYILSSIPAMTIFYLIGLFCMIAGMGY